MVKDPAHRGDLLDDATLLSLGELCRACNVEAEWIEELVSHGILTAGDGRVTHVSVHSISRVRKAQRLQRDFELNMPGLALALELLDEIERLRADLARRS
jgi:chaperone modulatory protein CbpM